MAFTSPHARWGFPEIKLGCFPPVACAGLAAVVGPKHAADLILTGRQIDGTEAAAIGLANEALGSCEDRAEEFARTFAGLSPAALAISKRAFYSWDAFHFDKGLAKAEKVYIEELMKTEDAREGINAFIEKRPPKWSGKSKRIEIQCQFAGYRGSILFLFFFALVFLFRDISHLLLGVSEPTHSEPWLRWVELGVFVFAVWITTEFLRQPDSRALKFAVVFFHMEYGLKLLSRFSLVPVELLPFVNTTRLLTGIAGLIFLLGFLGSWFRRKVRVV